MSNIKVTGKSGVVYTLFRKSGKPYISWKIGQNKVISREISEETYENGLLYNQQHTLQNQPVSQ